MFIKFIFMYKNRQPLFIITTFKNLTRTQLHIFFLLKIIKQNVFLNKKYFLCYEIILDKIIIYHNVA